MNKADKRQAALDYHAKPRPGKLGIAITKPFTTPSELSLAYSPGVAEPVLEIEKNPDDAFKYTSKGNLVAVITNGTAVLGLGRTGPLAFVTVEYAVQQDGAAICTEVRDIVYREDADPDAPKPTPPEARTDEDEACEVGFDSTMLFRYSALTFNGHRIHYDAEYAARVEGYDGLVVHGPLQAQLLMLMVDRPEDPLRRFRFRMTAPLMHTETATLCRKGPDAWVRGPDGRQCLTAVING